MAIGERIRFIRNLRGMTQKWLGQAVGFPQKTADIRMAQYESGSRTPKEDLVKALANVLEVSPLALNIPDIDSDLGFIHKVFAVDPSCDGHIPFCFQLLIELLHDFVGMGDRDPKLLCHVLDFHKVVFVQ